MRNGHINPKLSYWAYSSGGEFEVRIPGQAVLDIAQSGANDEAVSYWAPRIERPKAATVKAVKASCRETGAWDGAELADDATNWERVVWMLAHDLGDNPEYAANSVAEVES